jgi:hypothetical protein
MARLKKESPMGDDKRSRGEPDRSRINLNEDYARAPARLLTK